MDLKKFWDCIKKSYRKLSFYELITMVFFAFVISGLPLNYSLAAEGVPEDSPVYKGSGGTTLFINNAKQAESHYLVIGDSITVGGCNANKKDGVCGWREHLGTGLKKTDYAFDTWAQVGRSLGKYANDGFLLKATGGLGEYDLSYSKKKNYNAVFILLGVNDITGLPGEKIPEADMKGKMEKLINNLKLLNNSPPIILISVFPSCCTESYCKPNLASRIVDLNNLYKKIADADASVYYVDAHKGLSDKDNCFNKDYVSGDKLHPKIDSTTNQFISDAIVKDITSQTDLKNLFFGGGGGGEGDATSSPAFISSSAAKDEIMIEYQVPFAGLQAGDFLPNYINKVYKWLVMAGLVLVGIFLTIGGAMYISSAGDAKVVGTGKKYILNSLIGFLLLVSTYLILNTINPDATSMDVLEVKELGPVNSSKLVCGIQGLPCSGDGSCPANQYCELNVKKAFTPYQEKYIATDLISGINTAAHFITEYGGYAMMGGGILANALRKSGQMTLLAGLRSLAKDFVKQRLTALLNTAKYVFKPTSWKQVVVYPLSVASKTAKVTVSAAFNFFTFPVRHPKIFFKKINNFGFWVGATYQVSKGTISMLAAPIDDCPSDDSGKGICINKFFNYNLIPQGIIASNQEGLKLKLTTETIEGEEVAQYELDKFPNNHRQTFLYNKDGSLPRRTIMFIASDVNVPYYLAPPMGSIEKVKMEFSGKVFEGQANTDACDVSNNHCPCIEWETYDQSTGNFVCRRQARCVPGNDLLRLSGEHQNVSFCLTGDHGEPCLSDSDCRQGNRCLVVSTMKKAREISLIAKGILNDTSAANREDKTWKDVHMSGDYYYQKMCITLSGKSASIGSHIDTTCSRDAYSDLSLCELNTGLDGAACVPFNPSTSGVTNLEVNRTCTNLMAWHFAMSASRPVYEVLPVKQEDYYEEQQPYYARRAQSNEDCYNFYKNIDSTLLYSQVKAAWKKIYGNRNAQTFVEVSNPDPGDSLQITNKTQIVDGSLLSIFFTETKVGGGGILTYGTMKEAVGFMGEKIQNNLPETPPAEWGELISNQGVGAYVHSPTTGNCYLGIPMSVGFGSVYGDDDDVKFLQQYKVIGMWVNLSYVVSLGDDSLAKIDFNSNDWAKTRWLDNTHKIRPPIRDLFWFVLQKY